MSGQNASHWASSDYGDVMLWHLCAYYSKKNGDGSIFSPKLPFLMLVLTQGVGLCILYFNRIF
jgi:hypothetical protein